MRVYRSADGLPHDRVKCIVRDSRGFLWFCTVEGLARFDGSRFVRYTREDGVPGPSVNDIVEAAPGTYWIATNGAGLARFETATRRFTAYSLGNDLLSNRVNAVALDGHGRVWAGTDAGLFWLDDDGATPAPHAEDLGEAYHGAVNSLRVSEASLWVCTGVGLFRRFPSGEFRHYEFEGRSRSPGVATMIQDQGSGRLWIGSRGGVLVFQPNSNEEAAREPIVVSTRSRRGDVVGPIDPAPGTATWLALTDPESRVSALSSGPSGDVWMGTRLGHVAVFDGSKLIEYGAEHGIPNTQIISLADDVDGNVWIGTFGEGALRMARGGFLSFGREDGLSDTRVFTLLQDRSGRVIAVTENGLLNRFDDNRFVPLPSGLPAAMPMANTLWHQIVLQARSGDWWFRTPDAAYRVRAVSDRPARVIERISVRGAADDVLQRLYEDSNGRVWMGVGSAAGSSLVEWDPAQGVRRLSAGDGVPAWGWPTAFGEDRFGALWIGFLEGGVARYRDGRLRSWSPGDGVPRGVIHDIYRDGRGRLWIAGDMGGVARVTNEDGEARFERWTTAQGLSSDNARAFAEDKWGRLYVGTEQGVDRFDVDMRRVRHYTTADGLASNEIDAAITDRHGDIWFSTYRGPSRLTPTPDRLISPPPVWITALRIGGTPWPVGALGAGAIEVPEIRPGDNHVEIAFSGLDFGTPGAIRYEYELEGVDRQWRSAGVERTVTYARLGAGHYRFAARAVAEDGVASPTPAIVDFTVLPPIWLRSWFLALVTASAAAIVFGLHRYRLTRLLELERVRLRIATDLHDDIGASLSQIAVMSEAARRRTASAAPDVDAPLARIAATARDVVDSMSDIVWAINPRRDSLDDLTSRVRHFASDVLGARGVGLRFVAPADGVRHLGLDAKRELFLVVKEAINNVARHSDCSEASVELTVDRNDIVLTIRDNGRGFDRGLTDGGHGLVNMQQRVEALGGRLRITATPGAGTEIVAVVPARPRGIGAYMVR